MSTPWNIMESLKKWSNLMKEHIKKLNLDGNLRTKLLDKLRLNYQNYQEPDENSNNKGNTAAASATTTTPVNNNNALQMFSKKDSSIYSPTTASMPHDELLPLDPSILTTNLGVETIVIVTKVRNSSLQATTTTFLSIFMNSF